MHVSVFIRGLPWLASIEGDSRLAVLFFFFFILFSFFLNASAFLSLLAEVGLPFYKLHVHDATKKSSQMVSRFQEG